MISSYIKSHFNINVLVREEGVDVMSKLSRLFIAGILCVLLGPSLVSAVGSPPEEVKKAARQGIKFFIADGNLHNLQRLGFETSHDIQSAELREAFQIFTILPEMILNDRSEEDVSLATPTNQWQFIIAVRNQPKALLTVDLVNGAWAPVSLGSSQLAQELSDFHVASATSFPGFRYKVVRIFQAKSDLIELSQGAKVVGIIALTSILAATDERAAKGFYIRNLRRPHEVFSELRPLVKENIQRNK